MIIVSILVYNKLDYTKRCLESLSKTTNIDFKLIISDNGSTDGTISYLTSLKNTIVILNEDNIGFSAAHNRVMRMFPSDDVVLLNNDLELPPEWLSVLNQRLIEKNLGAVSPAIKTKNGLDVGAVLDARAKGRSLINDFTTEPDWITGSCFYISRKTIDKIGYLDEVNFSFYYEDCDYCKRIKNAGMKFECVKEISILHHDSVSSTPQQKKIIMENSRQSFAKKWDYQI